jgi:hypothetical protein
MRPSDISPEATYSPDNQHSQKFDNKESMEVLLRESSYLLLLYM